MKNTTAQNRLTKTKKSIPNASQKEVLNQTEHYPKAIRFFCDRILSEIDLLESFSSRHKDDNIQECARARISKCDDTLALMSRFFIGAYVDRAKTTPNSELLCNAIGDGLRLAEALPSLLPKFDALEPDELNYDDHYYSKFAWLVAFLTKELEKLTNSRPEIFRKFAGDLPYWPMLQYKNASSNKRFHALAEKIGLGKTCVIQCSTRAKHRLDNPRHRFLSEILAYLEEMRGVVRDSIELNRPLESLLRRRLNSQDPEDKIFPEELPIYLDSNKLAKFSKKNVKDWADIAIIPYIKIKFPNLKDVPAFGVVVGPTGKSFRAARKAILQSLRTLAPA